MRTSRWFLVSGVLLCLLLVGAGCRRGAANNSARNPATTAGAKPTTPVPVPTQAVPQPTQPVANPSNDPPLINTTPKTQPRVAGVFGVGERTKVENKMTGLRTAYFTYQEASGGTPPMKLEDFKVGVDVDKEMYGWLKEGYITVAWGYKIGTGDGQETLLAWETPSDSAGIRIVLTASGAVQRADRAKFDSFKKGSK